MPNMVSIIKQASAEAIEQGKPVNLIYGVVETTSPLAIRVDQKLLLQENFLVLCRQVTDHMVTMEVAHSTEQANNHNHDYTGVKTFKVLNGLKAGEKVMMIRMQGGQRFIVLDRVVSK